MAFEKGNKEGAKRGPDKVQKELKDCILEAFHTHHSEGGKIGGVAYLQLQMQTNAPAFMSLLGKLLPKQVDSNIDLKGQLSLLVEYVEDKTTE